MNKIKKLLTLALIAGLGFAAFAEGEDSGFDAATFIGNATSTVSAIVTAIGALLAAAFGIYLAFVGYRKGREALGKA